MNLEGPARDIALQGVNINTVGGGQYFITNTVNCLLEENALAALKPVDRSGYAVPKCMARTRESVFREIDLWLDDANMTFRGRLYSRGVHTDSTSNIMWICGYPGTGKSAIASSLVSNLKLRKRLGAYFFFKRGDANLGDPTTLWRTVAYDLARFHPSIKASLLEFLRQPGFRDKDISLHFEGMIEDTLTKHRRKLSRYPPVIILDALDECGWDDSHSSQRWILLDTLTRWTHLPRSFKLIVTSRNDRVPDLFHDKQVCYKITLETGDSVSEETQTDIRVFFEQSFSNIARQLGLPPAWPGNSDIHQLTNRAAGLFIWAKTAMSFMEDKRGDPIAKLSLVLSGKFGPQSEILDALYQQILDFSFKDAGDTTLALFKEVVGIIIAARVPLHRDDLKHFHCLLSRQNYDRHISALLFSLSSVIESDGHIHLKHLSFAEFLTDAKRCGEKLFFIDQKKQNWNLALACLRVMNTELRFNICGLESSHVRNNDVEDLPNRMKKSISAPLLYSCRFWAAHLCDALIGVEPCRLLLSELENFLYVRLLYWLEIMSLAKEIPASSTALLMVARYTESFDRRLSDFARDASRFVANFYTPISESAPHIYVSALPFSPRNSLIAKKFLSQFPETLSVVIGRDDHWPALANVLTGHGEKVVSVSYSPDGKQVVSGSYDKMLHVWDVETGRVIAGPFKGHTDWVQSVTYTPDGKRLVSGSSDGTICVWDVETGRMLAGPWKGHTDQVMSVACSPDGAHIVSGSSDKTIRLWDIETGQVVAGPFNGHTDDVLSVAYLPCKKLVVSGSSDKTLRVWDIKTGRTICGPLSGHTDDVHSVACSPDGKKVVSGSSDRTVRVWDIETGTLVVGPFKGHTSGVLSVAYSPNGQQVISSSLDRTLCVWDVDTGKVVAGPFKGHTGSVTSLAYSPDGKRVVSGSFDGTLRVWDIEICQVAENPFEDHAGAIQCVAYSPDGRRVLSSSSDMALRVWDVETGQIVTGPLKGHKGPVRSVVYSPKGKWIVSGSSDHTLCVWDVETGQVVAGPLEGHTSWVLSVACSPDERYIISSSSDMTLRLWDIETGRTIAGPFKGHTGPVTSVAYSPDGMRVVSGSSDATLRVWDIQTCRVVTSPFKGHTRPVLAVAYSPDGKRVVSGASDNTIRVWDVSTGQPVASPFQGHTDGVLSVVYSPDGKRVISGSYDKTLRVWDIKTGQVVAGPFTGNPDPVWSVACSPDGQRIASGSSDTTLSVWDIATGYAVIGPVQDRRVEDPPIISSQSRKQIISGQPDEKTQVTASLLKNHIDDTWLVVSGDENERHLFTVRSIGGPHIFESCRASDGWASSRLNPNSSRSLLFWVPPHARAGLCDAKTLFILGTRRTQVNLSHFMHGTSWTRCRGQHT